MSSFILPMLPTRTRRRRRAPLHLCASSSDPLDNFSTASLQVLSTRLTQLRDKEEILDRSVARHWRIGKYQSSVVASVGADYVRKLALADHLLAMGTASGNVVLSHLDTGRRVVSQASHVGQITAVDYAESVVASAGSRDKEVVVWDVAVYEREAYWREREGPEEINWGRGVMKCGIHDDVVSAVKVRDGKVYSASLDGSVGVWDKDTGEEVLRIRVGEPIMSMNITEKGYLLLGCASGRVLAYQKERGTYLLSIVCHGAHVTALDFCEETQMMVTGDAVGHIRVWSFKNATKIGDLPRHGAAVLSIQMDAWKVVSASREGAIAVSVLDGMKRVYSIHGFTKYLACVSFDRYRLVADGTNDVVLLHRFD